MATIRGAAKLVGKPESTLYRWRKTHPELFMAVLEYAERRRYESNQECKAPP